MTPHSSRRLVLVADDHDDAATLLAELLDCVTPFDGIGVKSGEEAYELTLKRRPVACLLSVGMPKWNGIATARAIEAALGPDRPVLVALTSREWGPETDVVKVFDHVIRKPVDVKQLIELINVIGR